MARYRLSLVAIAALALAACESDPGDDSTDTALDGSGDADTGDAGDDADTDAPPTAEICDDELDNDLDGDTDCADSDCAGAAECDEVCDDGTDNDLDGDIDCDDSDCAGSDACVEVCDDEADNDGDEAVDCDDDDCAEFEACLCEEGCTFRGGACSCGAVTDFPGPFSYINAIAVPPRGTPAECCFDFSGDGAIDNGLTMLSQAIGMIGEDVDIEALLADALENDDVALVFEWGKGEGEQGFWVHLTTNDVDDDGDPDQSFADRASGAGVFQIIQDSFDEYGTLVQFNVAETDDDGFTAGPSQFKLNIPIDSPEVQLDLDLTIEQATLTGDFVTTETGIASVNPMFDIDGVMTEYGGWKLGGIIPLDQIGRILNDLAADCTCAGFDLEQPIVEYGDDGTQYVLRCAQTPGTGCTGDDGAICEYLSLGCTFMPSLPSLGLNDIDTDGNGVGDALSVGIRLSAVGATLADPPVQE